MSSRYFSIIVLCLSLLACAAVPNKTQKLDSNASPVKDLQIIVFPGVLPQSNKAVIVTSSQREFYDTKFKSAIMGRFPATFRINDVPVQQLISVENSEQEFLTARQNLLKSAETSHILTLHVESFTFNSYHYEKPSLFTVNYLAQLWDVKKNRVVWEAHPELGMVETQPLLRTQAIAGQLLNGMNKDGLIQLKHGYAIDRFGDRIIFNYVGTEDK